MYVHTSYVRSLTVPVEIKMALVVISRANSSMCGGMVAEHIMVEWSLESFSSTFLTFFVNKGAHDSYHTRSHHTHLHTCVSKPMCRSESTSSTTKV